MKFEELVAEVQTAVESCLYQSLLSRKDGSYSLTPQNHEKINAEFNFLSHYRNSTVNTFLTRENVSGVHSSLFVGGSGEISKSPTRISNIVSEYIKSSHEKLKQTTRKDGKYSACTIRSPLSVVETILTDPSATETKQIVRFYIKSKLIQDYKVSLRRCITNEDKIKDRVNPLDLDKVYNTLSKYVAKRDNMPPPRNASEIFLLSLFASNGLLEHRITWKAVDDQLAFPGSKDEFCSCIWDTCEFRLSDSYDHLPALAELSNFAFGIPIAINGMTELLNGGLQQGSGEGTVTLLRGGAGSGKTTLSISIQRSFEALHIPTIFISSEETADAIAARRDSVLNLSQKNHSAYGIDSAEHEIIATFAEERSNAKDAPTPGIFSVVDTIARKLSEKKPTNKVSSQFARLLLIIDGVHNYIGDDQQKYIRKLIEACRRTNTHVLLTSSDDWAQSDGIEYFVDNYFRLSTRAEPEPMPHIERQISILKTRHQISLVGNHKIHFQPEGDLKFTPNFSELLRIQERNKRKLPDKNNYTLPFQADLIKTHDPKQFNDIAKLKHFDHSVSLVYGRGSASKTPFCFRLLCGPNNSENGPTRHRILIVSFLSPESYYQNKIRSFTKKLNQKIKSNEKSQNVKIDFDVITFSPGMVCSEEVYSKISDKLTTNEYGLTPYTGLLMDGIHNIFVQFPQLEKHPEMWSALLNLIRRVGIKSVLTFTDFEVWGARTLSTVDYENIRAKPLLVALSQSIDYGFGLLPRNQLEANDKRLAQGNFFDYDNPGLFMMTCFNAKDQPTPKSFLYWDKATEELRLP